MKVIQNQTSNAHLYDEPVFYIPTEEAKCTVRTLNIKLSLGHW